MYQDLADDLRRAAVSVQSMGCAMEDMHQRAMAQQQELRISELEHTVRLQATIIDGLMRSIRDAANGR